MNKNNAKNNRPNLLYVNTDILIWGRLYEIWIPFCTRERLFQLSQKVIESNDTRDIELAIDKKRIQLENVEL